MACDADDLAFALSNSFRDIPPAGTAKTEAPQIMARPSREMRSDLRVPSDATPDDGKAVGAIVFSGRVKYF